jgi:hypothetical protein
MKRLLAQKKARDNQMKAYQAQLEKGAEAWNQWRAAANYAPLDLSSIVLADRAGLDGVDFRTCTFHRADLRWTSFRKANFRGADLSYCDLTGATLNEADFTDASFQDTRFAANDLSRVIGLSSTNHRGPSTIGIDTLFLSQGKIPESFLSNAGVPRPIIDNLHALVGATSPIQFNSCFISYSSRDQQFAERLHSRMRQENLRVWFAPEDMKGGEKIFDQVERQIHLHEKLLLILSKNSMRSSWVVTELRNAIVAGKKERRQKLFPIGLCQYKAIRDWECFDSDLGADLAKEVRELHIPDFSKWKDHDEFEKAFANLLRDLKKSGA